MFLPLKLPFDQHETRWKSLIDPLLASPISQGRLLTGVSLVTGSNTVNHGLDRKLLGWIVVDRSNGAVIYSTQSINPKPELTLDLIASTAVTLSLWVF